MKALKSLATVILLASVSYSDNFRHDEMLMATENIVADYQDRGSLYSFRGTDAVDSVIRADVQLQPWQFGCQFEATYQERAMLFVAVGYDHDAYEAFVSQQNEINEDYCTDNAEFFSSVDID